MTPPGSNPRGAAAMLHGADAPRSVIDACMAAGAAAGLGDSARFELSDTHALDEAIRTGEIRTVIVPDAATLLAGIVDWNLDVPGWRSASVQIVCVSGESADVALARLPELATVHAFWTTRQRRLAGHRAWASLALSIASLLAGAAVLIAAHYLAAR